MDVVSLSVRCVGARSWVNSSSLSCLYAMRAVDLKMVLTSCGERLVTYSVFCAQSVRKAVWYVFVLTAHGGIGRCLLFLRLACAVAKVSVTGIWVEMWGVPRMCLFGDRVFAMECLTRGMYARGCAMVQSASEWET